MQDLGCEVPVVSGRVNGRSDIYFSGLNHIDYHEPFDGSRLKSYNHVFDLYKIIQYLIPFYVLIKT